MSYFTRYTLDVFRDDTPAFIPEPTRCAIQHELQTLYADASPLPHTLRSFRLFL